MGRPKKPFPTGHFRLRYPKNYDKSKIYPVEIEYIFSGRAIRRSMNISVSVDDWNPNANNGRGGIRASMPDSLRFNNLLLAKVNKIDAGLNEYNQKFPGQVNEDIIISFLDDKPITRKDRGEDFITFVLLPSMTRASEQEDEVIRHTERGSLHSRREEVSLRLKDVCQSV